MQHWNSQKGNFTEIVFKLKKIFSCDFYIWRKCSLRCNQIAFPIHSVYLELSQEVQLNGAKRFHSPPSLNQKTVTKLLKVISFFFTTIIPFKNHFCAEAEFTVCHFDQEKMYFHCCFICAKNASCHLSDKMEEEFKLYKWRSAKRETVQLILYEKERIPQAFLLPHFHSILKLDVNF